jgi:4,5-DOPA dioxygenase extradiol
LYKDNERGLDHGAWSMLVHLFPEATIPVLQISLDRNKTFAQHYEFAKKLAPLRKQNVLILASGNVTHNFSNANFNNIDAQPFDWALQFDNIIKNAFQNNDATSLMKIKELGDIFQLNHPTDEHYLPLLYLMGVRFENDRIFFPHMSWQFGTMSMRHILLNQYY